MVTNKKILKALSLSPQNLFNQIVFLDGPLHSGFLLCQFSWTDIVFFQILSYVIIAQLHEVVGKKFGIQNYVADYYFYTKKFFCLFLFLHFLWTQNWAVKLGAGKKKERKKNDGFTVLIFLPTSPIRKLKTSITTI